jgi:hypothetical protein
MEEVSSFGERDPFRRKVEYDVRCMTKQYLLGELASKAYLPGYGFPTGVVTFDHYTVADFKRGKYVKDSGRIDNNMRMRERPGRDLPIAIREYAPGSDVVLDGLVYRASGVLLNQFSPDEDYTEPQILLLEWRCQSCGHIGNESASTFDEFCSACGAEISEGNKKEYLQPAGFAVDFYSAPTTDISTQFYVPVQDPWLTANAELNSLFDSRLGTYRESANGHIFYHSSGEHGTGYAVCLRCGRAESMAASNEFPGRLQPGVIHTRLQGRAGGEASAACEGPDEAYAIKPSVHLGATDQTDVFELYLKYPDSGAYIEHRLNDPLPWTLAVLLRQALAEVHGISVDEIGYTVKPSRLPDCDYPVAGIVLYDTAGGGAGFASSAAQHLPAMITLARQAVECPQGCDSACQACLMGYDTRFHVELLDRHLASHYLEQINPYLNVAKEAQVFGDATQYCFEGLGAEILAGAASHGDCLRIFLSADYQEWDIAATNIKEACVGWKNSFDRVELVLSSREIAAMSETHREDLYALTKFGVTIAACQEPVRLDLPKSVLLAQVQGPTSIASYATTAPNAHIPNEHWWRVGQDYLVKSETFSAISTELLDPTILMPQRESGDVEIELFNECDGPLSKFGGRLWSNLANGSHALQSALSGNKRLVRVEYSDAYIISPWSLVLFGEVVDGLKQRLDELWDQTEIHLTTGRKDHISEAPGYYKEWRDSATLEHVIREYFEQMGEAIDIDVLPIRNVPHARSLKLHWQDGKVISIRFDHGVGCWSMDGVPERIDLSSRPEEQVRLMHGALRRLKVKYRKNSPTQIFIKKR